jgi:hypothetical protein
MFLVRDAADRLCGEGFESRDHVQVCQAPAEDENDLRQQESHISRKFGNDVADSLRGSPATEGLVLQLGDGFDVVLRRVGGSPAWKWILHGLAPPAGLIFHWYFSTIRKVMSSARGMS